MRDDFAGRPDAARFDDLVAPKPEDRPVINHCAAKDLRRLCAPGICGFLHIFVLFSSFMAIFSPSPPVILGNENLLCPPATALRFGIASVCISLLATIVVKIQTDPYLRFACGDTLRLYSATGSW